MTVIRRLYKMAKKKSIEKLNITKRFYLYLTQPPTVLV